VLVSEHSPTAKPTL